MTGGPEQLAPVAHTVPQPPQLFTSVVVFTHVFVHKVGSEALLHDATHVAPLHAVVPPVGAVGHVAHVPGAAPHCKVPTAHG